MLLHNVTELAVSTLISVYLEVCTLKKYVMVWRSPCMNACPNVVNIARACEGNIHYMRACIHTW